MLRKSPRKQAAFCESRRYNISIISTGFTEIIFEAFQISHLSTFSILLILILILSFQSELPSGDVHTLAREPFTTDRSWIQHLLPRLLLYSGRLKHRCKANSSSAAQLSVLDDPEARNCAIRTGALTALLQHQQEMQQLLRVSDALTLPLQVL